MLVTEEEATAAPHGLSWDFVRGRINDLACERGEWAGYPMPIDDLKMVVEPRHPLYDTMHGKRLGEADKQPDPAPDNEGWELVNTWYSRHHGGTVAVIRRPDGKSVKCWWDVTGWPAYRYQMHFNTFIVACSPAWSAQAEMTACMKLRELIRPHLFDAYMLCGSFIERSERSGITYMFRKLRPTLALGTSQDRQRIKPIAALCLHPIGHYEESFAGCMVPTDDVIAHLTLMRGDEHGFWKKANHHSLWNALTGL